MANNHRLLPGDAVQYNLSNNSRIYGLVLAVCPAKEPNTMDASPVVARVAFVAADPVLTLPLVDLDPASLLSLPDPELQAFLAVNIKVAWPDDAKSAKMLATQLRIV